MNSTPTVSSPGTARLEQEAPRRRFVPAILPWILGGGALATFLATLNGWVSFRSAFTVNQATGYEWQAPILNPLYWLVTLPIRWLPDGVTPLALNLFSAVCAALVIALLARSVALLPYDRTEEQRMRERGAFALFSSRLAWVPPVFAALLCGLQLTFWEHATAASKEMFDLLLIAYITRSLLEFRIDARQSWLSRSALICGAAMANDWAMIALFPAFIAALIWINGIGFFNLRFLTRMFVLGLAGLSVYLVTPIANAVLYPDQYGFWLSLKYNLLTQKGIVGFFLFNKYVLFASESPLWVLALPSLVPLLALAIKWPSYFGDTSKLGVGLTRLIFHVFSLVLLFICTWVALDPPLSPRRLLADIPGGVPGLSLYYFGALSAGYFLGYFLLVFGVKPTGRFAKTVPLWFAPVGKVVVAIALALAVVVPALALYRNLPNILFSNGPVIRQFAEMLLSNVPADSVVLSDDAGLLFLAQSHSDRKSPDAKRMFLNTGSLVYPQYHQYIARLHGSRWPAEAPTNVTQEIDSISLMKVMAALAQSNSVYYLHSSFGYYFEIFYPEPQALANRLLEYPPETHLPPPLSKDNFARNQAFWSGEAAAALEGIQPRANPAATRKTGLLSLAMAKLHLPPQANPDARILATHYSRALNAWGVAIQRSAAAEPDVNQSERLDLAADIFSRAFRLNPENVVAKVNLDFNREHRAGKPVPTAGPQSASNRFGKSRNWDQVMGLHGPFDEPGICLQEAAEMAKNGHSRQAAQQLERVVHFAPDNLRARLSLAQLYALQLKAPNEALRIIEGLKRHPNFKNADKALLTDLLLCETTAHLARKNLEAANQTVAEAVRKNNDLATLATASSAYVGAGYFSNAVPLIDAQLKIAPQDAVALVDSGYVWLQLKEYEKAIAPLSKAVSLNRSNVPALFNRAVAYLSSGRLDEAQRDYEALEGLMQQGKYKLAYGLAEIAYQRKDTNTAVRQYTLYLATAPTNTTEATLVRERLQQLRNGASP